MTKKRLSWFAHVTSGNEKNVAQLGGSNNNEEGEREETSRKIPTMVDGHAIGRNTGIIQCSQRIQKPG